MRRSALIRLLASVLCICSLSLRTFGAKNPSPDIESIVKAGKASLDRLENASASWSAIHRLQNGAKMSVEVLHQGERRRWTFSELTARGKKTFCRLMQRDGVWFVSELERRAKYRPYEATLNIPLGYLFLVLAEPAFLIDTEGLSDAKFDHLDGDLAVYHFPLPSEQQNFIKGALRELEHMAELDSTVLKDVDKSDNLKFLKERLENGIRFTVNRKTGLIVSRDSKGIATTVENFKWLDHVRESEFAVRLDGWKDFSNIPSTEDVSEWTLVGYDPLFEANGSQPAPDAHLLNLRTGELRRLPYEGFGTLPGCFLHDRRSVISTGFGWEGEMQLLKVDLID